MSGDIFSVRLALGHNNDTGVFNTRGTREFVEERHIKLLADRGYRHPYLVTPDVLRSEKWNNVQKGLRSVVEVVNARLDAFNVTNAKFRMDPDLQQMVLIVCYNLTQRVSQDFAVRICA